MRINVYAEELTDRAPEIVTKEVEGRLFYGIRLWLGFPFEHRPGDDDSSAVTFWVPWTKAEGSNFQRLIAAFTALADTTGEARARELRRLASQEVLTP